MRLGSDKLFKNKTVRRLLTIIEACNRANRCQHPSRSEFERVTEGFHMMLRQWGLVGLGVALSSVGVGPATAQTLQLERSGNVFHAAVCARGNPAGTARCFAHVVTDARGNPHNGKANP